MKNTTIYALPWHFCHLDPTGTFVLLLYNTLTPNCCTWDANKDKQRFIWPSLSVPEYFYNLMVQLEKDHLNTNPNIFWWYETHSRYRKVENKGVFCRVVNAKGCEEWLTSCLFHSVGNNNLSDSLPGFTQCLIWIYTRPRRNTLSQRCEQLW